MFKLIGHHWQRRRERFYLKNRWHLILDFSLALIIVLLIAAVIGFNYYRPSVNLFSPSGGLSRTEFDVNNPPLNISLSLASSSLHLDDGAILKISLKNFGKASAEEIKINLVTTNRSFAIAKVEELNGENKKPETEISNREIMLSELRAGEEKELVYKVSFVDKEKTDRVIKWQAQTQYLIASQIIKEVLSLPDLHLAAELKAEAVAYYNSPQGDQLGSGPLPPVIGLPTNYWIFFEVTSSGDFKNLVFSGKLPKGVELTERRSVLAGEFKYNASSRQVIWTVPELKNQSDSYRVGFEIQFTPSESQFGKVVDLITGIKYYARDTLINDANSASLSDLDTNLNFDRINKGQGEIVQP